MNPDQPPSAPVPLGPVAAPLGHVPADWWRTLFGATYLLTDADVLDPSVTRHEVDDLLALLPLTPDTHVLDLCCGQGRHALELARRGFTAVEGLDRSRYLIRRARAAARREGLAVRFREGDCRRLPHADASVDVVLMLGNSFGYFASADDDRAVLEAVRRVLRPGGTFLLDQVDGDYLRAHLDPRSWEWLDEKRFVCRERSLTPDGRLIAREVITHTDRGVLVDQFYAERLYTRADLFALLHEAGFVDVQDTGTHTPASTRGQDLGMMGHRLRLKASVPARLHAVPVAFTPDAPTRGASAGPAAIRHVAVVMGDPRQPDAMKLGGRFDEDDFDTIDRLKAALATLPGYRFTYLDDHATLVADLERLRGHVDLVLNLCDEGFDNDPHQELHVPALLDLADLPYTGAGPQALAFCYDKSLVRGIAREMGLPVPEARFLPPGTVSFDLASVGYPVIVKPNAGDSSFGITQQSVAYTPEELAAALTSVREAVGPERPLLVERFLTGKDLTCGLIGNPGGPVTVLPITEDDYSTLPPELPRLCGYEAKWLPDSPYMQEIRSIPADLPEATRRLIELGSLQLFERLGCRDYARFDWRLDADGTPYLLEANPNPGWCWDGHLTKQAAYAGHDYPDVLRLILEAALQRLEVTLPTTYHGDGQA